ncbi:unnamed protein product [Parnassius mnemosyne]|uniref:Uncharacterized protein n=1 Tax=Parnassius mnemosyne TaxID=213953 RepID=A0AAV1KJ98_9NEOP
MEKKIVSLIGLEYTFGSDCPDSMPEEETLQHEMEAGMDMVEVISLSQCNEYKLLETEKDQALPAPQIIASGSRATAVASPTNQQDQEVTLQSAAPQITVSGSRAAAVITSPPTVQRERPRRIRNLNPRHSVAEQANMARQDFWQLQNQMQKQLGCWQLQLKCKQRLPKCKQRRQKCRQRRLFR